MFYTLAFIRKTDLICLSKDLESDEDAKCMYIEIKNSFRDCRPYILDAYPSTKYLYYNQPWKSFYTLSIIFESDFMYRINFMKGDEQIALTRIIEDIREVLADYSQLKNSFKDCEGYIIEGGKKTPYKEWVSTLSLEQIIANP